LNLQKGLQLKLGVFMPDNKYGVLSNQDIEQELGENILIHPFSKSNLKEASYNLTVSHLAWDRKTKASIYDKDNNVVRIRPDSSALLETNESIWVSSRIGGSYHSKVKLVAQGLSHIGTTLDPGFLGSSLITIHNHSDETIDLIPGENTFATLVFHYTNTETSIRQGGNPPGRSDVLLGYTITDEENAWLDKPFRTEINALRAEMKKSSDFQSILQSRQEETSKLIEQKRNIAAKSSSKTYFIMLTIVFIISLLGNILLNTKFKFLQEKSPDFYFWASNICSNVALIIPGSVALNYLSKQQAHLK
jgi:deoxycytidine triphosphate deaminase